MARLSPSSLPFLGAGLGYRRAISGFYDKHAASIGFLEVMPEHWFEGTAASRALLKENSNRFPVVTHSVSLSVGTADGADQRFATKTARLNKRLGAVWTSDHLCFTKVGERNIGQLTPIPYTDESLAAVVANVKAVQSTMGRTPFLLENISQYFTFKANTLTEPEFFDAVVAKTGCGVLLDVTNLRNNAANIGIDPKKYLDEFPLGQVVQFHLAGAQWVDGRLLDTHGAPIHKEVWKMTADLVARTDVRALLIERDQTFGPSEQLAGELRKASRIMARATGAT